MLFLSQSSSVYICRIPLPISRLDRIGDESSLPSNKVFTGRRFGVEEPDLELLTVPYLALGVREAEILGLWNE